MFKKLMKKIFWLIGAVVFGETGIYGILYILGTTKKESQKWLRGLLAGATFGLSAFGYVGCACKASEIKLR